MRDITPGTLSILYNGPLRRSCLRSRVRLANRHKREYFLIHRRYRRRGCTSTPCKPFVSTLRGDACHRKFYGQGRKHFLSPRLTPNTPQEAVALAALVREQVQYQVLPPTEIPVPKSLVVPIGMDILARQTTDSVTLTSIRQKLHTPTIGDRLGGAQLRASTRFPLWRQRRPRPSKESRFPQTPDR